MFCDKFLDFLVKKSLNVIKNKKNAEVTKIVFIRKLMSNLLIMIKDNKIEIIKNRIR